MTRNKTGEKPSGSRLKKENTGIAKENGKDRRGKTEHACKENNKDAPGFGMHTDHGSQGA